MYVSTELRSYLVSGKRRGNWGKPIDDASLSNPKPRSKRQPPVTRYLTRKPSPQSLFTTPERINRVSPTHNRWERLSSLTNSRPTPLNQLRTPYPIYDEAEVPSTPLPYRPEPESVYKSILGPSRSVHAIGANGCDSAGERTSEKESVKPSGGWGCSGWYLVERGRGVLLATLRSPRWGRRLRPF